MIRCVLSTAPSLAFGSENLTNIILEQKGRVSWVPLIQLLGNFPYNTVGVFVRPLWRVLRNKASLVVCFLLGNSPASEFYMPTFRNTLSVPSSYLPAYEDGTDSVFRSVGI